METPTLATVSEDVRASLAASVPFPARLGSPQEFALLVAFLIEHDYMNGEVIRMDGALRMTAR
jgi:NAD(P)-dependent dehydrogenase (short-subunit alcohol dehydrogenase family)